MAVLKLIGVLIVAMATQAAAQAIRSNAFPLAGDICKDYGESWRGLYLGPCEKGTTCKVYKRGVFKCVPDDARGSLPLGTVCYDETKVKENDKVWRQYYKERNCVWSGTDTQGTPKAQCIQNPSKPTLYTCGLMPALGKQGCATVAGSMIWGKYNDNQAYDMCNGCPCTMPNNPKGGKYPRCYCDQPCTPERASLRCPTD